MLLLDAISYSVLRLRQLYPVARQIAQILNLGRRYKATPHQSVLQQLRDPLTIRSIGLASRNCLDVMRIHQRGCWQQAAVIRANQRIVWHHQSDPADQSTDRDLHGAAEGASKIILMQRGAG